jgi:dolichyl-phosphate-mannose--protein O-mannosyl transferase
MTSIDNYYLLLALMHGFVGDALLVLILLGTIFRLVRFEMQRPPPKIRGSSFGFTLAGIFLAFGVTIATVYVGLTAMPVFALMTGWAEGYLLNTAPAAVGARVAVATVATPKFAFRRVVA